MLFKTLLSGVKLCKLFICIWGLNKRTNTHTTHIYTPSQAITLKGTQKACTINFSYTQVNFTRSFWIEKNNFYGADVSMCVCVYVSKRILWSFSFIYSESGVLIKTMPMLRSKSSWWIRKSCLYLFVLNVEDEAKSSSRSENCEEAKRRNSNTKLRSVMIIFNYNSSRESKRFAVENKAKMKNLL